MNGIVHTAEFFLYFYPFEIENVENAYKRNIIYKDKKKIIIKLDSINMTISKETGYTGMKIDFIKLLNKPNISNCDLDEIYKKIYAIINEQIYDNFQFPVLKRWDFRLDVKFNSNDEKNIIYKLYDKTTKKLYGLNRVKYNNNSICTQNNYNYFYKTNAKNYSLTLNIYDKENERIDKNVPAEAYEKNVIRYEIQLRKKHIDYNKYKKHYEREIDTYLNEELFIFYIDKYIKPIIFYGNYYDIYNARKIINANVTRKDEREKLINFLKLVSQNNIDKAKEIYSPHVYKHCIDLLDSLDINPVLIPKNYGIKKIDNPLNSLYTTFGKFNK